MTRRRQERRPRSSCPIHHAVEILGDRWTLLVVRDLVFNGRHTFSALKKMEEGIATNILVDRLAKLAEARIVERRTDPEDGRRVLYRLTEHGRRLVPLLLEMMVWSRHHTADVDVSTELVDQIEADRDGVVAVVLSRLDAETLRGGTPR